MHVLLRGGLTQRLRLASGLVLFTFAAAHFLNHATGLVSLELMHGVQEIRTAVTRSSVGTAVLTLAIGTHISLGLYKLAARRTLRLPLWEALQILIALSIPFLLFPHIVNTRIAHVFFGVNDTYQYELFRLWPDRAVFQSLLLLLVWTHGCIGLHYWLRLSNRYDTYRPILWTVAVLVPMLAVAGFATSGQMTADIMSDPASLAGLKARSNWPNAAASDTMAWLRNMTQYSFGALLALIAVVFLFRRWRSRAGTSIAVTYTDGPTVTARAGMTLLELSRASGLPHASVCGGRARCFTCRVKIEVGIEKLPPPNRAESLALRALEAPANVRLACQLRPTAPMTVTILNRPAVPGPVQVEFVEIKSVVSAHARAVLGNEAVEIRSGDPEALTHWFSGRIGYPVRVPHLKDVRFSLSGGRIDYLENRAVATLTLGEEAHPISLYVLPPSDAEAVRGRRNGYSVVGWEDANLAYFAVSDLGRDLLEGLQDAVREGNQSSLRPAGRYVLGPDEASTIPRSEPTHG